MSERVRLLKTSANGSQNLLATFKLQGRQVVCDNKEALKHLEKWGIVNVTEKKLDQRLFPKDGRIFLENLQFHFKSLYAVATPVEEA